MKVLIVLLLALGVAAAQSPQVTNQDVIEMTKAGLSSIVIVAKISSSPCLFDTSVSSLTSLKADGVDDAVVSAMIRCAPSKPAHDKPYIWVGASEEWIANSIHAGTVSATDTTAVGVGASSTTVQKHSEYGDVTRELSDKCQGVVITYNASDADYAVTVQRFNAGHLLTQRNDFSIFRAKDGKLLLSSKTTWLKNAAADICKIVAQDAGLKPAAVQTNVKP